MSEKIILAADHAGFKLKEKLKLHLKKKKYQVVDMSPRFVEGDDYPDHAFKAATKVASENVKGVFVCGTGTGMCMSANKVQGVRAALPINLKSAVASRAEEDANVICFGSRLMPEKDVVKFLDAWLKTKFLKGRHQRRVHKIQMYEND